MKNERFLLRKIEILNSVLALILVLLLFAQWGGYAWLLPWTIVALVAAMIKVEIFAPLSFAWLKFSELFGGVVSKIILSILFFCIVSPIAYFRRKKGYDAMQISKWKKGSESVFRSRDAAVVAADLEKPY